MSAVSRRLIAGPQRIPPSRWLSENDSVGWQVVLRSKQGVVVLYNKAEKALNIASPLQSAKTLHGGAYEDDTGNIEGVHENIESNPSCPLCKQSLPTHRRRYSNTNGPGNNYQRPLLTFDHRNESVNPDYFQFLGESHQGSPNYLGTPDVSRPSTPSFSEEIGSHLEPESFLEGYYSRFFVEVEQLGRGMSGSVFLCQHILNGIELGYFACKKIPVSSGSRKLK